jgi:signal transduction histidine kinase
MEEAVKLNEAFNSFTKASRSLEVYYEKLSDKVRYLTAEVEMKNAQLNELQDHHKRNLRLIAMGEMAASIVHEIRSPLCSIELYSSMLSNDLKGSKHSDMANGISTGIKSLNNILTNMLFFAKPQKPSMQDINVNDALEESLKILAPLIDVRGITLVKDNSDVIISGDTELLKQVMMNILLNAVQAMPQGGELKVYKEEGENYIAFAVCDQGRGIDIDNIERIFDPFFSTKDKGTGLGLTIAHKIMQSHNGFIKAERNRDRGSTFRLYFPKKGVADERAGSNQPVNE